jgi:lipopolysaccharide exporter
MSDGAATPPAAADTAAKRPNVGHTIARNSAWLLLDTVFGIAASFYCSIAVARGLGPERMGDYNYVLWFASVLRAVTELAIPMTFRKFASELMGREDYVTLKALARYALRLQALLAGVGATVGLVVVAVVVSPERQLFVTLAVLSVVPALLLTVPSGALQATENLRHNVVASLCGTIVNLIGISLSVFLDWGLIGVLGSFLTSRSIDCTVRFVLFRRIYAQLPGGKGAELAPLPPELRKRMFGFAARQLIQIAFNILLWERVEVFFIKHLATTRDVAFFSISVTLIQYVMQVPAILSTSAGATLMVQQGRGPGEVARIGITASWFCLLVGTPLLFGIAGLADPLLHLVYGVKYLPAIPVLTLLGLIGMFQVAQFPLGSLMLAADRQNFIIFWGSVQVVISVVCCLLFIPHLGPLGAAVARGICHAVGATGFLLYISRSFKVQVPVLRIAKLALACGAMFVGVRLVGRPLPPLAAILVGVPVGVAIFAVFTRLLRYLDEADQGRLRQLGRMLPSRARGAFTALVDFLVRARPPQEPRPVAG